MFRIQVFSTDVDKGVVDEALRITHNQSRKVRDRLPLNYARLTLDPQLLQEFGLDFRFILDALLVPSPLEDVPPPAPVLAPAPRTTLPPSTAPGLPPRVTRSTAAPAAESAHAPPPGPVLDLPTRSGKSTPTPKSATPPTDTPAGIPRNAPTPTPGATAVQRNHSPSAQPPSPMLAPVGRRTRSPFPPTSASTPSRPTTPSPLVPSRGTSGSMASLAPSFSSAQPALVSPVPVQAGIPSLALAPSRGGTMPLSVRGANPAPPPRSRERPGSAAGREREQRDRPPPVSVPRREGFF
jgi:hypothetical protein